MNRLQLWICLAAAGITLSACTNDKPASVQKSANVVEITNRLHVPPEVVSNLGITFATVKTEKLGEWKELPGALEVPEEKRFTIFSPTKGRLVSVLPLWSRVQKGQIIAEIASEQLLSQQHALVTAANVLESTRASVAKDGANPNTKLRLNQTERAFRQELNAFSVLTGLSVEDLLKEEKTGSPKWLAMTSLTLQAPDDGIIIELSATAGEILDEGKKVALIYNLKELLYRGTLPEAYRGQVAQGGKIRVLPTGSSEWIESSVKNVLPITDETSRSIVVETLLQNSDLKLQHGLSAVASVLVSGGEYEEAVVPSDCIVADGLETVVYKKDTEKPAYVIRIPVEVGARSGHLVSVLSGVMEGDDVVCAGIHQLKLTGLGKSPQGGHFHADGTWHEGDE